MLRRHVTGNPVGCRQGDASDTLGSCLQWSHGLLKPRAFHVAKQQPAAFASNSMTRYWSALETKHTKSSPVYIVTKTQYGKNKDVLSCGFVYQYTLASRYLQCRPVMSYCVDQPLCMPATFKYKLTGTTLKLDVLHCQDSR